MEKRLAGLAFSGGGIRSATFNLGVLQALADHGLLKRFDYLSTVSGGGYIGSWLTALFHRESRNKNDDNRPVSDRITERLRTRRWRRGQVDTEDDAVHFLRQYSNYLTPKAGFFSADTWTVITTYLRNFLLNLTILVAFLGFALLVIRPCRYFLPESSGPVVGYDLLYALVLSALAMFSIGVSMATTATPVESVPKSGEGPRWWQRLLSQGAVQRSAVLPLFVAALAGSAWLCRLGRGFGDGRAVWWMVWVVAAYFGVWLLAAAAGAIIGWKSDESVGWRHLIPWSLPTGIVGDAQREWLSRLGAWLLIYGLGWLVLTAATVYGPVLLLWAGVKLKVALASGWIGATLGGLAAARGGGREAGRTRRLIATVAPYVFIAGLLCLVALGLDWALTREGWNADGRQKWDELIAAADPPTAAETLTEIRSTEDGRTERLSLESSVTGAGTGGFAAVLAAHRELLSATSLAPVHLALLGILLIVLVLLSWRVDVNEFSMHGLYRNRLVRCYLGASVPRAHRRQRRQPFTGFHGADDIPLTDLEDQAGPYHLVNTTLNLVGGDQMAWQERQATSFTFSPGYCGFDAEAVARAGEGEAAAKAAYRQTDAYAQQGPGWLSGGPRPLELGTAMAISGAAVSPHMGFRSSSAIAFLLTVFNIRLGWWLGNPEHETTWAYSGPRFALLNLLSELFGMTKKDSRYVYLSDGGHFENLGIYELVRRRCRFIVATDAGADPELAFDDLGNAIRKCRADFGIDVEIDVEPLRRQKEGGRSRWHCVVGRIRYDRVHLNAGDGVLLYLKASLTGDESTDILNYASQNPAFPHETTADQWFDESQFESYRRLGLHIGSQALDKAVEAARRVAGGGDVSIEQVLTSLRQTWYPPSHAIQTAFTRHTETLKGLFEKLRTEEPLAFLNPQFYIEWNTFVDGKPRDPGALWLPPTAEERKEGFYFCNSLLQLMEDVYLDLDLENEYDHPDNRGWINLFRHWTWSGMFRVTWAVSASTYGARFQTFCWQRLGLEIGRVEAVPIYDATLDGPEIRRSLEDPRLNFLERELVREMLEPAGADRLFVLQLTVSPPGFLGAPPDESIHLCFGVALSRGTELRFFRVRDHLRRMGVGRRALRKLIRDNGIERYLLNASRRHLLETARRISRTRIGSASSTSSTRCGGRPGAASGWLAAAADSRSRSRRWGALSTSRRSVSRATADVKTCCVGSSWG